MDRNLDYVTIHTLGVATATTTVYYYCTYVRSLVQASHWAAIVIHLREQTETRSRVAAAAASYDCGYTIYSSMLHPHKQA